MAIAPFLCCFYYKASVPGMQVPFFSTSKALIFFCFFNTSINFFPDFFLFPLKTELFEIVQKNLLFSLDKICFL